MCRWHVPGRSWCKVDAIASPRIVSPRLASPRSVGGRWEQVASLRPIQVGDFTQAFKQVRASVGQKDLGGYREWNKQFGSTGSGDEPEYEQEQELAALSA